MFLVLRRSIVLFTSMITLGLFGVLFLVFGPTSLGFADQFNDLLGEAVEQGTQVDAARSRRDAAESSVRKAWSKFLPSVKAYGDFGHTRDNAFGRLNGSRNSYDSSEYGVSASLPIYRGGTNYYGLKEAKSNAKAEGHSYVESKQILLLDTVRAILGIIRDREIVHLQRRNQDIVGTILKTTQSRYDGGEATRTDIAIAEDQYFAAQSVYTQAIDNLNTNEIDFKRIIGRKAGRLSLPKGLPSRLPKSLNEAIMLAEQQNPQLLAAIFRSEAADHSLKASYGGFLPSVDLNLDYKEERYHGEQISDDSDLTVKLNFTVPLFKPEALASSQVSRHVSQQRKYEARDARLTAKAMATVAWKSYHTAQKRYRLGLVRIKAAKEASRGMRRELDAGQRTVLDVLDTQERLVQAKVQAANAKFERYMAAHLLLSAIGRLDSTTSNVAQLNEYVSSNKTRHGRTGQWQTASIKANKPIKKIAYKAPAKSIDSGAASIERRYAQGFNKIPSLPVLKTRVAQNTRQPLPKLETKAFSQPKKILERKKVVQPKKIIPKARPTKTIKVLPTDEQKELLIRKGIYSKLKKKKQLASDEIITGSIKETVKKVPLPLVKKKEKPQQIAPVKVADFHRRHQAFAIHKIPLPVRKSIDHDDLVTGSLSKRTEPLRDEPKEELYPATYQNRFAVWWNDKVDKVIGPSSRPKPKLVDVEKYRKHRKSLSKQ
ncbi:MAG: TolC family protein [Hyphomicrobiales bacterium]